MTGPALIVPAAGRGSRLASHLPKALVLVHGRPMLDWLLDLYRAHVVRVIVVTSPPWADAVADHAGGAVEVVVQDQPTGMLDAITAATSAAARHNPPSVWVTWCDQIALHPRTVERLARRSAVIPRPGLTMPTVWRTDPYIHLQRDVDGRITRVLHRREGDAMPDRGESDMGVFALSAAAFFEELPRYAGEAEVGRLSGERNFLPFIPWLAARAEVVTVASEEPEEAIGVNTPEDLQVVASYLQARRIRS